MSMKATDESQWKTTRIVRGKSRKKIFHFPEADTNKGKFNFGN